MIKYKKAIIIVWIVLLLNILPIHFNNIQYINLLYLKVINIIVVALIYILIANFIIKLFVLYYDKGKICFKNKYKLENFSFLVLTILTYFYSLKSPLLWQNIYLLISILCLSTRIYFILIIGKNYLYNANKIIKLEQIRSFEFVRTGILSNMYTCKLNMLDNQNHKLKVYLTKMEINKLKQILDKSIS